MRIKWYFRNERHQNVSEITAFSPTSTSKPPVGQPNLEVCLSYTESELFQVTKDYVQYSNLSHTKWRVIRSLADDRSIIIKKAGKGSCVEVWDRPDYLEEADKQLADNGIYNEVKERQQLGFVTCNSNLAVNLKPTHAPFLHGKGEFTFLKTKSSHSSRIVMYPPKFEFLRN